MNELKKQRKLVEKATEEYLNKLNKAGLNHYKIFIQMFPDYELENKVEYGGFRYPKREGFGYTSNSINNSLEYVFYGFPIFTSIYNLFL